MKKVYLALAASVVTGALLVGGLAGTAAAWDPEGDISKKVENVTTGSGLAEADSEADAIDAKLGDVLKYVVKVWNPAGQPHVPGHNDLVDIVMTDKLPDGVELVSDPSKRDLVENIDRLKPGESKEFTYEVKVTENKSGVVVNTACFEGDSEAKDAYRDGCDDANTRVTAPEEEEESEPQVQGEADILPVTGAGSIAGLFAGVSGLGYVAHRAINRKR